MTLRSTLLASAVTFAMAGSAFAAGCDKVTFSDVGWTDITATTAATSLVLEALGYETETKVLSVPVTYEGMSSGDVDVFLGNWMPTMESNIAAYRDAKTVDTVRANLEGAKYTLATNAKGIAKLARCESPLPQSDELDVSISEELLPTRIAEFLAWYASHSTTLQGR